MTIAATNRQASASTSTTSSLMQDVPGAFPAIPQSGLHDEGENGDEENAQLNLHQVLYSRRAEYVRPKHVRIKIGTWNVAAYKGTEKDVGAWFVGGQGLAERLTGLNISEPDPDVENGREEVAHQESRYERKQPTVPKGDNGSLPKDEDVGLYVLGLQEVVDINSATEALRPYTDPAVAKKWRDAMEAAIPRDYEFVAEQQLIGLLLLVYAAPDVAKDTKCVSTTSVGTGLMGYMGNKGAVTARLVLGETTRLVFVNCHLAAGADKAALERRNWDAQQIISRTKFEPIHDAMDLTQSTGEQLGDEDFAFWCGDLNYRLEGIPGEDVRRLLMLHTRNEYDLSQRSARKVDKELQEATNAVKERLSQETSRTDNTDSSMERSSSDTKRSTSTAPTTILDDVAASEDPSSLQTTLASLLPHDELSQQMRSRKAFHDGWREGAITFLPTYKYDAGSVGVFDSSEKKRAPSWCDRILYRTRRDRLSFEAKIREEESARKKDEEWRANGTDMAASDEEILYDYDPDTDGAEAGDEYNEYEDYDDAQDGVVITKEGFEDELELEYYTAHQRVLSSDHKPLDACFMLKYDAVVPELKAKVHAEVAKDFDKAENEGRPDVTVAVDQHGGNPGASEETLPEKFEGVWFGDVRWAQSKHRSLTIANTSRVPANFTFIERPIDAEQRAGIAPRWLTITMNEHELSSSSEKSEIITLEPGESCLIELELRIMSMSDVHELNNEKQTLEDILVLRVENGRDHFIPVRARWLETSLGQSIGRLVRIPEGGIRKLQGQKPEGKKKVEAAASAVSAANAFTQNLDGSDAKSASSDSLGKTLSRAFSPRSQDEPVRFSAPRELFRLTEAIEEMSTRVVAEWDMMHAPATPTSPRTSADITAPPPSAPWDQHPAWPFDEACWKESRPSHWEDALGEACNALDNDLPLETSLPEHLPRIQRLYVLCNLLLLVLQNMIDGIITTELWTAIESYLAEIEKVKQKPANDDQRTAMQEILSVSPSHSISFVLVTSMLERMLAERSTSGNAVPMVGHSRSSSKEDGSASPLSPTKRAGGAFKRVFTGGKAAALHAPQQKRERGAHTLAKIFADAMIRSPSVGGEKARQAMNRRKIELVEVFLRRDPS